MSATSSLSCSASYLIGLLSSARADLHDQLFDSATTSSAMLLRVLLSRYQLVYQSISDPLTRRRALWLTVEAHRAHGWQLELVTSGSHGEGWKFLKLFAGSLNKTTYGVPRAHRLPVVAQHAAAMENRLGDIQAIWLWVGTSCRLEPWLWVEARASGDMMGDEHSLSFLQILWLILLTWTESPWALGRCAVPDCDGKVGPQRGHYLRAATADGLVTRISWR